ncbi:MAG: hypothetical protein OEY28_12620 [Nitrospira sp.]|nr:hypothetical protein [Nitrospira sp.]
MICSICASCGAWKRNPAGKCAQCNFKPQTDEEKAKALILSTAYEGKGGYKVKAVEELKTIAAQVRSGRPYEFNPDEVQMVIAYAHEVLAIPARRLIVDGLKWLGPPAAILLIMYFLLYMSK